MGALIPRAVVAALVGAISGAALLVAVFNRHPGLVVEMDRDMPRRIGSGFYPVEIAGQETFAWTSDRAQITIPGLERESAWRCVVRVRGGRPAGVPQPDVAIAIDGQVLGSRLATNDYEPLEVTIPSRAAPGLRLTLTASATFKPGSSDPRDLGVQVDRLECTPEDRGLVLPPAASMLGAAGSAAVFGSVFALLGPGSLVTIVAAVLVAAVQALPFSSGLAPYTDYPRQAISLALWIAIALLVVAAVVQWRLRRPLRTGAGLAAAVSGAVLFVKLLALLHPSKAVIDALFHAHRLDDVLSGRYFFTQLMPGGVQFPYAIALYVFAAPWAGLTRDHVALLRIVVSVSEAVAGILLYWAIVRNWRDARVGLGALALYHVLPVSYWVVGSANLTNAFGQSAALAAMAPLVVWTMDWRQWPQVIGVTLLAAVAFLSHVSTFALLAVTLGIASALFAWRGGPARPAIVATLLAAALAIALYYGRPEFFPAYRSARDARASEASTPADVAGASAATPALVTHTGAALVQSRQAIGWPIVLLAAIGTWRVRVDRRPGRRLMLALGAWGLAFAVFFVFAVAAPARVGQERYALEFIARAAYAASPAALVLAAAGLAWMLGRSLPLRVAGLGLLGWAIVEAGRQWLSWIR